MNQKFRTRKATTHRGSAMETRDHSKNGASLKSQTSRGNFFNEKIINTFF